MRASLVFIFGVFVVCSVLHRGHVSYCSNVNYPNNIVGDTKGVDIFPAVSPIVAPRSLFPLLAPSPSQLLTSIATPKLTGECSLNFTAAEGLLVTTSNDCLSPLAPYLANVVCCPQLEAVLAILVGQSSKNSNSLALNTTQAVHCLSDLEKILVSQGSSDDLQGICSVSPSNLTEATCAVKDAVELEGIIDSERLLNACGDIDTVKECCSQTCQRAISDATHNVSVKTKNLYLGSGVPHPRQKLSKIFDDCKIIVLRWLASRLGIYQAKKVLRGLTNCSVNNACPLAFPSIDNVTMHCGNGTNKTSCCDALSNYMSYLQRQSFVTNLQAFDCASFLGMMLKRKNVTEDVYHRCHVTLKDFSVQAATEASLGVVSGCLLQSLPSDVVVGESSGISFLCDLNDNIPAPWLSESSQFPFSSCNKSSTATNTAPMATSYSSGCHESTNTIFQVICGFLTAFVLVMV